MRSLAAALAALVLPLGALAQASGAPPSAAPSHPGSPPPGAPPAAPAPKALSPADTQKALYAVGVAVANSLEVFALSPAELDTVLKGLREGTAGKPKFQIDASTQQLVNDLARSRAPKAAEKASAHEKQVGPPYLAKAAKEKGAKKTPGGAIVIPEKEGTGGSPAPTDKIKVNYSGSLVSGRVFESTAHRGPAEIPLAQTVPCWAQAFPMLKVGARAKIVCPPDLAYGPNGNAAIPGNAVLIFDVELVGTAQ